MREISHKKQSCGNSSMCMYMCVMLGTEPTAVCMLVTHSTSELHPPPKSSWFHQGNVILFYLCTNRLSNSTRLPDRDRKVCGQHSHGHFRMTPDYRTHWTLDPVKERTSETSLKIFKNVCVKILVCDRKRGVCVFCERARIYMPGYTHVEVRL